MSPKLKHALAASLSLTLAYLFPLYFGIEDTSSAAITVMVIAASDSLGNSLQKGIYRVVGTLFGAAIGLTLIALFPQERFAYLVTLSILVSFFLYLARAYRGDQTIFMLTAITMMMMFDNGQVDNTFLYASERVMMTIIGIVIYTFASVYLFPFGSDAKEEERLFLFVWFDPEDLKGALVSFLVFWSAAAFWIYFAIPYGHLIMVLATALSLYTAYSIVKPSVLIVLFSLSFVFAAFSYIFILPNLVGWWSLGIFLFLYAFIGFYFIDRQISIFYLVGMATFLIKNEMNFDFATFMFVLLIFYMFLLILLVFDYFPFNQTSERMFLILFERFKKLLRFHPDSIHLAETLRKLKLYGMKIDFDYFGIEKHRMETFLGRCEDAYEKRSVQFLENTDIGLQKLKEGKL